MLKNIYLEKITILLQKKRGIKEPHKMSPKDLKNALHTLYRRNIKHKSYSTCRKFKKLGLDKHTKKQNVSESDLHKATKLHNMSIDDLKQIARLQWIKYYDNLSKEDLIYVLLRSEKNLLEDNYIEYLNNNTDDRIKAKINNIRIALIKLRNIINKKDRDKIKKDLYEIEKMKRLTKSQEERIYNHLIELANILNKKEIYKIADYDDLDYFGIKDIENLLIIWMMLIVMNQC